MLRHRTVDETEGVGVAGELDRFRTGFERLQHNPVVIAGVVVGILGLWAYLETGWRMRKLRASWS